MGKSIGEEIPLRIITAAAIFDGHDAAIGIFRRIFQSMGCEVIHLGHDRGADEVAKAAIQEDAHCVAITSYQGGAVEMFTHTKNILNKSGFGHVCLVGGGGGQSLRRPLGSLLVLRLAVITSSATVDKPAGLGLAVDGNLLCTLRRQGRRRSKVVLVATRD